MNKSIKFLPLLAASAVVAGCQDYDLGMSVDEIRYKKDFESFYGKIDPHQDWNAATRASVTVSTNGTSDIKIYALVDGQYSIVGDYAAVSGTKTLGFDCRKDVTDILVSDGKMGQKTTVGGSVTFFGTTRAANYSSPLVSSNGHYIEITHEEATKYATVIREINDDSKPYDETNLPKVTKNFKYISNGPFSFYPMYWNTNGRDVLGVYYIDSNGDEQMVDIYAIKSGDELQDLSDAQLYLSPTDLDALNTTPPMTFNDAKDRLTGVTYDAVNKLYVKGNYILREYHPAVWANGNDPSAPGYLTSNNYTAEEYNKLVSKSYFDCHQVANNGLQPSTYNYANNTVSQRSKRITVDIPAGTEFGFYLKNGSDTFYSDASKNIDYPTRTGFPSGKASYAASVIIDGHTYFCFEDWKNGDFDLNDLVFRFADPVPTVIDNDAVNSTWDLLCEDLGSSFDTDFNDIVVRVEYVSGRTNATVTPLAAGGTLADYLFFDGVNLGEIHQMFGASPAVSGSYEPINVTGASRGQCGKQISITVPNDWSMASYQADKWDTDTQISGKNMGGFQVKVLPAGSQPTSEAFGSASEIAAPAVGQVPEMICVPDQYTVIVNESGTEYAYKYQFGWAQERKSLSEAFNEDDHKFSSWIADYTEQKDWYKYPSGYTVERKFISKTEYVPGQDEDNDPEDLGYGTALTEARDGLTNPGGSYNIFVTFSTDNLPTTGNVQFTVEIDTSANGSYQNAQEFGIWRSNEGGEYSKIESPKPTYNTQTGIVQYTIPASTYENYDHLKIIVDAGLGATITKVSYKSTN